MGNTLNFWKGNTKEKNMNRAIMLRKPINIESSSAVGISERCEDTEVDVQEIQNYNFNNPQTDHQTVSYFSEVQPDVHAFNEYDELTKMVNVNTDSSDMHNMQMLAVCEEENHLNELTDQGGVAVICDGSWNKRTYDL